MATARKTKGDLPKGMVKRGNVYRADPKRVQQLLGHETLAVTMELYAKVRAGSTREAIGRLSYGCGVQAPAHLVEFPTVQAEGNHHNSSTTPQKPGASG
jgi:hypothetical protein